VGSEINFAMSSCNKAIRVNMTTPIQSVLGFSDHRLLTLFGGRDAEYSGTGKGVYGGMSLKILHSRSTMSSSSTSLPGILDVSSSLVYWYRGCRMPSAAAPSSS
jgi:hypothetical protein